MKTKAKKALVLTIFQLSMYITFGQCASPSNIHSFTYKGKTYEIIKENKTWVEASACAKKRGGILVEINDTDEQNAIYSELVSKAHINNNNTIAQDGGGGAYVWIGANDFATEGSWVWDGNNDKKVTLFWVGDRSGNAIDGLFNNWGDEPDDYGGQDALGLSLNGWPLGEAGQWNDVDHNNELYFVIEY